MTTLSTPLISGTFAAPTDNYEYSIIGKIGRVTLYLILSLLSFIIVLVLVLHAYAAWHLSHPPVASLTSNPMLAKNLSYSEITFTSADQSSLVEGWWIPAMNSGKTVVLSHGYGANREEFWVPMYDLADLLHGMNYNVLMFDYGFASQNYRTPATGGITESQQLLGALQFAQEQGSEELIVWGFSMGAGTALQAALHSEYIDAMILDSTYIPDDDTIFYNIQQQLNVPKYPTLSLIQLFFPLLTGTKLEDIPSAQIQETAYDFPIFLIHGTADDKSPTYLAENVAKAQTNVLSNLWVVPDAIHEMIFRTHPEEYVARTTSFLDQVHLERLASAGADPEFIELAKL